MATYTCEYCGEEFTGAPSRGKANHITCSKACLSGLRRQLTEERHKEEEIPCSICGRLFWRKSSQVQKNKNSCCSSECLSELRRKMMERENNHQYGLKGSSNPTWVTDEKITHYGYRKIRVLDHPFRDCDGFVFEHRLVAEQFLLTEENSVVIDGKRYLKKDYQVHHIDHNRLNNSVENLEVLTASEHRKRHPNDYLTRDPQTGRFIKNKTN